MDLRGCIFVVIVVINCICVSLIAASAEDSGAYGEVSNYGNGQESIRNLKVLEAKLREEYRRELGDLEKIEKHLMGHMNLVQEKKRQLEIKKRTPVQCLVNIVSCWKRK